MSETRPPLYDGTLEFLLQEYESLLERIQRIWKRHESPKRYDAIEAEFPIIKQLYDTGSPSPSPTDPNLLIKTPAAVNF